MNRPTLFRNCTPGNEPADKLKLELRRAAAPGAGRTAARAALCVLLLGATAVSTLAADQNAPQDPQDPRFSSPPANLYKPAPLPGLGSPAGGVNTPAPVAAPPAAVNPQPALASQAPPPAPRPLSPDARPAGPAPSNLETSLATHAKDKVCYSFKADSLEIKTALALFAGGNNLNIVPDNDVTGTVTLDVRDLPLPQMMRALLEAGDCSWREDEGLIRVRNTETRTFSVDYLRLSRKGMSQGFAMLASGAGGGIGGGGLGGGGISGGSMMGGQSGQNNSGSVSSMGGSTVSIQADSTVDFWTELKTELNSLLTEAGRSSLAINKTAGIIQVSDRPSALKKVEHYLAGVEKSTHRQVDLEAKLYDVTLNDQFQFGIDWVHVAEAYGGLLAFGGSTLPVAAGGHQLLDSALGGLNRVVGDTTPGANPSTLVFQNFNTAAAVNALSQQGQVEVISKPRIRTMNNQTALIKVGEEVPFFNTTTILVPGTTVGTSASQESTMVSSITIGTILSITPQISDDNFISLDISPVLTSLKSIQTFGQASIGGGGGSATGAGGATAPDLDTKQASTIVRVRDGTTVVMGGLIETEKTKNKKKIPLLGDIPYVGKLFTGTFDSKTKKELVIFVTPRIVREDEASVPSNPEDRPHDPKEWPWDKMKD